jgi:2-hydroxy-6-oxonona-2,4-dienedioate hydrolase
MEYVSFWKAIQGIPFRQDYADAGGVRTRFLEAGTRGKPVVIFLHGFMSHADVFMRIFPEHAKHFHVFAIDVIGMGYSDKPDYDYHAPVCAKQVADFMDAVNVQRASVVGTSFGSRIVSRFAIDFPDRLDKLTLVSPAGLRFDPERGKRLIKNHLEDHDESTWDGASAAMRLIVNNDYMFDDAIAARMQAQSQPGAKEAYPHLAVHHLPETAGLSLISADDYRAIDVPALVIKGIKDELTDTSLAEEIASLLPQGRAEYIQGSIHAPYLERPDAFNAIHIPFLKGDA